MDLRGWWMAALKVRLMVASATEIEALGATAGT